MEGVGSEPLSWGYTLSSGVGLGPRKIYDFVVRNVELLCLLVSGAGR